MIQITRYIRRHHIALLALFVALGGTSYAAVNLPNGSVGTAQLKQGSVTAKKLSDRAVAANKLRNGATTARALRNGAVTTPKLRNDAVTSVKVLDGTLLAVDFAPGQLPEAGGEPKGPAGGALAGTYPNPGIAAGAIGPDQFGEIPAVRLIRDHTTAQVTIASGGQGSALPWPLPTGPRPFDIGGFFDPANNTIGQCISQGTDTCIVIPRTGTYVLSAGARWVVAGTSADNGIGYRALRIHGQGGRQSGTTSTPAVDGSQTIQSVNTIDRFEAGQAVFVSASQNSGVDLAIAGSLQQVYFAATWVGP